MKHLRSSGWGRRRRRPARGLLEHLEGRQLLAPVAFAPRTIIDDLDADGPDRVVAADIDGDGDVDAVVGSYRDNRVAWYENDGQGHFAQHLIGSDATEVRDVLVIDLDGDLDLDVVVAAYGADSIRWYENKDGQGTFDASITLTSDADGVLALAAADLDQDGDQDLVSGSWFDDKIAWYLNDGQGNFGPQQVLTTATDGPRSLQLGDVNGDGRPDIVVAARLDDTLSWFANLGGGSFAGQVTLNFSGDGPESIHLADADNDNDLDLFVALYWDGTIAWFENLDGKGNFGTQQTVSTTANRGQVVVVADLDGDGDQDLLSGSYYDPDHKAVWYPNTDGQGAFGAERIISLDVIGIEDLAVADVDRDGRPDVLAASAIDNKVSWFRNADGQGAFERPRQVVSDAGGAASTDLADLDGDGDADVLTASYWDNKVAWYENLDGQGTFSAQRVISNSAQRAQSVRAADLDGDGDIDVLSASYADGTIAWYQNLGQGNFAAPAIITNRLNGAVYVHAADLDGDGDADVISASAGDSIVAWYENLGAQQGFGTIQILTRRAIGVEWISTADLDGDGDTDILNAAYGDGTVSWFENLNGLGSFAAKQTLATLGTPGSGGPTTVEPIDLDRDGDLDLVSTLYRQSTATALVWIERLADGSFAAPVAIANNIEQPEALTIADVDGNGTLDLIVGSNRYLLWVERLPDGSFQLYTVASQLGQVFDAAAGDVTGDGRTDLVSASFFDSAILLFRNRSVPGDLDGDGNVDAADIDRLCHGIRQGGGEPEFDLSGDGRVDFADVETLVKQRLGTTFGDSNLDGRFNSQDLVVTFQSGEYEDGVPANSSWAEGDWNCDAEFDTKDLVLAFQEGGYSAEAHAAVVLVAQPPLTNSDLAGPTHLVMADLDRDGDRDLLVASSLDGRVGWYENLDGAATFSDLRLISAHLPGAAMVLADDLDGDGDLDVAAAVFAENRIVWFRNLNGRGDYGEGQVVTNLAIEASSVAAADLDGDGDLDLISTSSDLYDSDVSWYENTDGQGSFGPQQLVTTEASIPYWAIAADLDGDGDQDLVSASYYDHKIAWYENLDAASSFSPQQLIGQVLGASCVIAADIDGDKDLDIVAGGAYYNTDAIVWFENQDGKATFGAARPITSAVDDVATLQAFDMDGDGDLDLLSASFLDDKVAWYENLDGAGSFGGQRLIPHAANGMSAAFAGDLDGDQDADVAVASFSDDLIAWVENVNLQFGPARVLTKFGTVGVDSVVPLDVDGDGDLDLAAASVLDSSVVWLENLDGMGHYSDKQTLDDSLNGAIHIEAVDLNGDQRPDLLVSAAGSGELVWYENRPVPEGWGARQLIAGGLTRTEGSTAADVDGDGDLDVIAAAMYGGQQNLVWFENQDGLGSFGPALSIDNDLDSPRELVAVDLDGDRDPDLAVVSIFDNRVVWFQNLDGRGNFGPPQLIANDTELPVTLAAGDIDGDGDADLLVGSFLDNSLQWYQNLDGQGNFDQTRRISQDHGGPESVQLADLDGDGDLDALVASVVDDTISWHENVDAAGEFGPRQVIDDQAAGASDVAVADLDGDGDQDVIGTHYDTSRIVWYRRQELLVGDFDGDGQVTAADIDRLCQALREGEPDMAFDLTQDGLLDSLDLDALVLDVLKTTWGDANLDGAFNSGDLVQVFAAGQYEDQIAGNSGWATGDWNCDTEFTTGDLVTAFQKGGYQPE